MIARRFLGPAALALGVAACSSASNSAPTRDAGSGPEEASTVGCNGEGDTYSANLVKPGVNGVYTFTLTQASPAPPDLAGNTWTMKIADKSGASPALSQVVAAPFMPLMGHPSDQTPIVTANADGTFSVANLVLFMPGLWTITMTVTDPPADAGSSDGGAQVPVTPLTVDDAVFTFCVN